MRITFVKTKNMKKVPFLVLMLTLLVFTSHEGLCQQIAPTSEEEYVMGSVGYKMYKQMGVELKSGYSVKDLVVYEYGERKADFKGLYRSGETKPCAILFLYTKLRGAPEYYCIPTLDAPEALWDRYRMSLSGETDNKQEQLQFFSFALAKALMLYSGK
jgi:hypothetical protein